MRDVSRSDGPPAPVASRGRPRPKAGAPRARRDEISSVTSSTVSRWSTGSSVGMRVWSMVQILPFTQSIVRSRVPFPYKAAERIQHRHPPSGYPDGSLLTGSLRVAAVRCGPGTGRQGRSPRPYKARNIETPATTPITSCTIAPFTPLTPLPPLSRSRFRAPSRSPRRSLYRPEEPSPGSEAAASTVSSAMSKTSMTLSTLPVVSITPT